MALNQCLSIKAGSALLLLLMLVVIALQIDSGRAMKITKSRKTAMKLLGGVTTDTQQFFADCKMSSNDESCSLAIDNHFVMEYTQCAFTFNDDVPWWRGHLENPSFVTNVYIQNADWLFLGDVDALLEFNIIGNGYTCYTHAGNISFDSKTFPCDILASYIEIRSNIKKSVLTLCEVQVYGSILKLVAPNRSPVKVEFDDCEMSSVKEKIDGLGWFPGIGWSLADCWKALDGSTSGAADKDQCANSLKDTNPWFKATFKMPHLVQKVRLYNRADCCKDRLTKLEIRVSGDVCAEHGTEEFNFKDFNCNIFGDRIIVQRKTNALAHLTLCEMEVYGFLIEMETADSKRVAKGCFKDDFNEPDLSDGPVSITHMHTAKCDKMCRRLGRKYFGLQAGKECWCGDTHGKYGVGSNGTNGCSMKCEGKPNEECGSHGANLVYELRY